MREEKIVSKVRIRDMFEELGDTSWVDQEHMKQITTKNEAIVGQCQHLTDTSQDQEKQINNVIQ